MESGRKTEYRTLLRFLHFGDHVRLACHSLPTRDITQLPTTRNVYLLAVNYLNWKFVLFIFRRANELMYHLTEFQLSPFLTKQL